MRTFVYSISHHRPDGLSTVWIHAERNFSSMEIESKVCKLIPRFIDESHPNLIVAHNSLGVEAHLLENGVIAVSSHVPMIEVILPKRDVPFLLELLKRVWGGEWKDDSSNGWSAWDENGYERHSSR